MNSWHTVYGVNKNYELNIKLSIKIGVAYVRLACYINRRRFGGTAEQTGYTESPEHQLTGSNRNVRTS
ncbi:hypothetical protein GCM10025859_31160 [Alicyclobacillus fastidiosus]|nr:hypothetical protein GCM10025859_31160 [Alicyclobacillus fastidiosus]